MSEFTAGVLFLKANLSRVEQHMQGFTLPYLVRELNDKWGTLFVEGDNYEYPPVQPKLAEMSREVPLLFFQHPEDHGWGYSVYSGGAEVASLWVSYELSFNLTLDLAERRYPEIADYYVTEFQEQWQELMSEVLASESYRRSVTQQYLRRNFQALQVFEIGTQTLQTLEATIAPETYFDWEQLRAQSQIFMAAVGIQEMSWMSYHYLEMSNGDSD